MIFLQDTNLGYQAAVSKNFPVVAFPVSVSLYLINSIRFEVCLSQI